MVEFETSSADERQVARVVKTTVSPRPIAWVSTVSEDGHENLAPFSSYNYFGSSPPVVHFNTSTKADGTLKDSARNAIDTGEFAVNVVTEDHLEVMDHTSEGLPHEESEFESAGVARADCTTIDAPRVADAPVTMECTFHDTVEINDRLMVLGDVQHFHVDESVMTDGEIDALKMDTVGRLGGPYYTVSDPVDFERRF